MQYENKILISAILIIGLGLVSFNVINTGDISGAVSKANCRTPTLNADRIGSNVYIDINGDVSSNQRFVYFTDERQHRIDSKTIPRSNYDKKTYIVSYSDNPNDAQTPAYAYVISACDGSKVFTGIPSQ